MTREERAIRLAEEFVKDLAQCLFDNKDVFTMEVEAEEVKPEDED
jgi:hypothetical protein